MNDLKPVVTAPEAWGYRVIDHDGDVPTSEYESLDEARGSVRYNRLRAYSIWHNNVRVENCDPDVEERLGVNKTH